jgi:hypothetical protein
MIIVTNGIETLTFDEVPKVFNFSKLEYNLIGCTLYLNNHFISKVLVNNTCHIVDNLPNTHQLSYFSSQKKFWKITNIFYQYKN